MKCSSRLISSQYSSGRGGEGREGGKRGSEGGRRGREGGGEGGKRKVKAGGRVPVSATNMCRMHTSTKPFQHIKDTIIARYHSPNFALLLMSMTPVLRVTPHLRNRELGPFPNVPITSASGCPSNIGWGFRNTMASQS